MVKEGEWHVQARKDEESAASVNHYDAACDGGDQGGREGGEGLLYIPAENVAAVDVKVVNKRTPKRVAEQIMGEEWGSLSGGECRPLLGSESSYLPQDERERIWLNCPRREPRLCCALQAVYNIQSVYNIQPALLSAV